MTPLPYADYHVRQFARRKGNFSLQRQLSYNIDNQLEFPTNPSPQHRIANLRGATLVARMENMLFK